MTKKGSPVSCAVSSLPKGGSASTEIARQPIDSLLPEAAVVGDFARKNTGKPTAHVSKISKSA